MTPMILKFQHPEVMMAGRITIWIVMILDAKESVELRVVQYLAAIKASNFKSSEARLFSLLNLILNVIY